MLCCGTRLYRMFVFVCLLWSCIITYPVSTVLMCWSVVTYDILRLQYVPIIIIPKLWAALQSRSLHWFLSALGFSDCLTYIYVGFCLIFDPWISEVSYIARYPISITPNKYNFVMSLNSLGLEWSQADNSTKSRFNWSEFSSYVLLILWRYPILFDLIVIGCRQFILFISGVFSPVSIRSDETAVCHSNILWLKIIHYELDVKLTTICESSLVANINGPPPFSPFFRAPPKNILPPYYIQDPDKKTQHKYI